MEKKPPVTPAKKRKPQTFKKRPDGKNDTGRPEIPIDLDRVRELSKFMYVDRELAACLGISFARFRERKGLEPAIREAMAEGRASGCASLRSMQMSKAMNGDRAMLIWLGKQYLAQSEKITHANDEQNPITSTPPAKVKYDTAEEAAAAFEAKLRKHKS